MEPEGHQQGSSPSSWVFRVKPETLNRAKLHIPQAPATCCHKRFYYNSVHPTRIFCCQHHSKFFLSNVYKHSPLSLKTPEFCPLGDTIWVVPQTAVLRPCINARLFAGKVQSQTYQSTGRKCFLCKLVRSKAFK